MIEKPFYISFLGLNPVELQVLQVAVGLLKDDGYEVRILKKPSWDVHMLVANMERTDADNIAKMGKLIPVKIVFAETTVTGKNTVTILKPIRVLAVKEVLSKILKKLSDLKINEKKPLSYSEDLLLQSLPSPTASASTGDAAAVTTTTTADSTTAVERHTPASDTNVPAPDARPQELSRSKANNKNFFELLCIAKQEQRCFRCKSQSGPSLIVDGQTKTISHMSSDDAIDIILNSEPETLSVHFIEQAPSDTSSKIVALDSILWKAAVKCSNGNIIEGHVLDQPVTLRAWPNFTRQSFDPSHLKLAALLAKESMSVNQLSSISQIPIEDVINFYNAAFVVNLIERRTKPREESSEKRKASPAIRDIISRLAKRLRIQ